VLRWSDFAQAAPEVAEPVRELLERHGFVFAATIRRDGSPRISAVEAHLVEGELMLVMIEGTLKARDLLRDPRIVLNAPIFDPADPKAEFKLRGRVVAIDDRTQREATAAAIASASGWRPPSTWHYFAVRVDDVAHLHWDAGALDMWHWTQSRGTRRVRRPAPALSG
jgi:Pyridoxamine 5'-phosphate oxidase